MHLTYRFATENDVLLFYQWFNDYEVRKNSYSGNPISLDQHSKWFKEKINDKNVFLLLFLDYSNENYPVGQVRIERIGQEAIISISIDAEYRGKGLATDLLNDACLCYFDKYPKDKIIAYIKKDNKASIRAFCKASFDVVDESFLYSGTESFKLVKQVYEEKI